MYGWGHFARHGLRSGLAVGGLLLATAGCGRQAYQGRSTSLEEVVRRDGLERCVLDKSTSWGGPVSCGGIIVHMNKIVPPPKEPLKQGHCEFPWDESEEAECEKEEPEEEEGGWPEIEEFTVPSAGPGLWKCSRRSATFLELRCKLDDVAVSLSEQIIITLGLPPPVTPPSELLVTLGGRQFVFEPVALDPKGTITSALYPAKPGRGQLRWTAAEDRIYALLSGGVGATELYFSAELTLREREGLLLLAAAAQRVD